MKLFLLLLALVLWSIFLGYVLALPCYLISRLKSLFASLFTFIVWYLFKFCRFVFRWCKQRVEKLINRDNSTKAQKLSFMAFLLPNNIDTPKQFINLFGKK